MLKTQKKQEQEWQAKPKGLPSTFAWGPEVAEQLKKKEEAKHDAWNPPLGSEQKNEVEKKQSFGWLPLNDATIIIKSVGKVAFFTSSFPSSPRPWPNVDQNVNVCACNCSVISQH